MTETRTLSAAQRFYRARRIGATFGRVYVGIKANHFISRRIAPTDMRQRWSRLHRDSAGSIYDLAVELRGLILKGCQFIGSRADVLPEEYVRTLSKLQDRVPPRSFPVVRRTVESELQRPLGRVFASFSERPIAAASLAQVHEATLHSGERVAVKVQYPEIEALVHSDLANLRALFRAVGLLEREVDLAPLIEELARYIPRELDFVNEAHNAERVAGFFADCDDIHVPRVFWSYTSRRLLVMEFIDGIKISDTTALRAAGVDCNTLMRRLVEAYCEQILVEGFFHADPHPGNLLVQPPTPDSGRSDPRLVFLDFGLAKDLPSSFRQSVVAFAAAMLGGDSDAMAQALADLGFETRDGSTESLAEITRVVLGAATRLRHQSYLDPEVAREASEELPRLVRENPIVRIPTHVVLIGRVLGLLSGLGRTLDAQVDMLHTVLPYALGVKRSAADAPQAPPPSPPPPA